MNEKLMNLDYLIETEQETIEISLNTFGKAKSYLDTLVDLLFNLNHFIDEKVELETTDHFFQVFAFNTYARTPYSLKVIGDLWVKGYYLEAIILIRHLLEGLVQVRYFYNHRDKISDHSLGIKRVSFKVIFEEIVPGFYDAYYGKLLSSFAHGNFINALFREERESAEKATIIHGSKFNDKHSLSIIKQSLAYGYGFLNFMDIIFPSFKNKIEKDLSTKLKELLKELHSKFILDYENPEQIIFWKLMPQLIEK
jgi:hypothetical protein